MNKFYEGAFLVKGKEIIPNDVYGKSKVEKILERPVSVQTARNKTIAYKILKKHNVNIADDEMKLKFDKLVSHDITYVGIIQTARASGMEKFPIPYVLTNCHNSLCAVGGTINEDDHQFGLSAARKYGGIYVPPHQAVIHQYARECISKVGDMILGSDSHTRYGALGTLAIGEGGPELVKQLLNRTYDIKRPEVIGIYLKNKPVPGVGPQDVALCLIKELFSTGLAKNRILEFVGDGIANLSVDFRNGIDVMTTETACLSSIWMTDEKVREYYEIHGRLEDFELLEPDDVVCYDVMLEVDLAEIRPMIAMPFHPSNVYSIRFLQDNLEDIIHETEEKSKVSLGEELALNLHNKIIDGKLKVDQGVIAGCAGGSFENIYEAGQILRGRSIGNGAFALNVYPASMPIYYDLMKEGVFLDLVESGAVIKTAFCGPCFGAGDIPANGGLSIRHSTRNFPNREGSMPKNGQIASVALMDSRSIAATAANGGFLTDATEFDLDYQIPKYYFDSLIYEKRIFDSKGVPDKEAELVIGPNIKDWPEMDELPENLLLKVVSMIHDPVTTTDELIPSGETSSYRSNPEALAEFTLSRKDPKYVERAKVVRENYRALKAEGLYGIEDDSLKKVIEVLSSNAKLDKDKLGIGSTIFAVKPGDGSAREQAASCQKVLGGWANLAREYATKRYRSNLINWGMIPFRIEGVLSFSEGDYIYIKDIRTKISDGDDEIEAYVVNESGMKKIVLLLDALTDEERQIILDGCLINYYRMEK